jgi:hypothetical protein
MAGAQAGPPDPRQRAEAIVDRRFAALVHAGTDLTTIGTWDQRLSRRTRILVPADVQAFVVPAAGGEATVPITGGPGDPDPFTAATAPAAGVHLHWAMPDALLTGGHDPATSNLGLPTLPDRWVVIRSLQPVDQRQVQLRGWVLDAVSRAVTPLPDYSGTTAAGPGPVLDPLDGAAGGTLLWTASYTASSGRFAFHDPLDDIAAGQKLEGGQAAYTVAGWWSDLAGDPLAGAVGPQQLDTALAALGWHVVHDADDYVLQEPDPRLARAQQRTGLRSPEEFPPTIVTGADGRVVSGALDDVAFDISVPVDEATHVIMTPALPRYATLVHGSVLGVPVTGGPTGADDRPAAGDLGLALGQDLDDVVAAFGAAALQLDPEHRRSAETLLAAFTSGMIEQIGSQDGLEDLAELQHGNGFWSLAGTPLPSARPDRLRAEDSAPVGPLDVGRKGRAATAREAALQATLQWKGKTVGLHSGSTDQPRGGRPSETTVTRRTADAREVVRPAPRFFRPQPPMLAVRGARPSHRHHGDGLFDESGRLRCRYPRECATSLEGVLAGAAVVPSLGSGAIPDEVLSLVRETVLLNPYGYRWLAAAAAPDAATGQAYSTRIGAEMVRLYGTDGRYDGSSHLTLDHPWTSGTWRANARQESIWDKQVAQALAEHSLLAGTPPSPVAITTWRQPWVPLWVEWRVLLDGTDSVAGWALDGLDLAPPPPGQGNPPGNPVTKTFLGRSPLGQGAGTALRESIRRWVEAELQRDATGSSALPASDQNALAQLGDLIAPYDLVSASLDGIREQLLGIPYVGLIDRGTGTDPKPTASGDAVPLFGGTLKLVALRLVDAFGRVLDIPASAVAATATTLDLEVAGLSGGIRVRPRIQHLARWLFRLADASQPAATQPAQVREAFVDQLDPEGAISPVAGFLLPDHIDEELEAFTPAGTPIGQLGHDAVTGAVIWEPAPGRPVPPDAGPLVDLDAQARTTGEIAAALVQMDAAARHAGATQDSALSALLRAIDTTLWTVDTFAAVGSPTVAGLVGRPVAVVRALLTLDAPDDLDEVEVTAVSGVAGRRSAFEAMREQRFPVKLGTLTRSDDSLLGFYVDDDYTRLHLVDRVIAAQALDSGRHRGQLGLLGRVTTPPVAPLSHPYLVPDGTLWLRAGQTVRLTLLTLPLGRVHLTSGLLPRKELALSDEWVSRGLKRLVPSVRVGPVLVDPSEIRLPLVTLLGDRQTFTRRTGPLTWRDDPIVAATQSALLPKLPHEVQEGWVRVTPTDPATGQPEGQAGGQGGTP